METKPLEYSTKSEKFSREIRDVVKKEIERVSTKENGYRAFSNYRRDAYRPDVHQTVHWLSNGCAIQVTEKENPKRGRERFHSGNEYSYTMSIVIAEKYDNPKNTLKDEINKNIKLGLNKSLKEIVDIKDD